MHKSFLCLLTLFIKVVRCTNVTWGVAIYPDHVVYHYSRDVGELNSPLESGFRSQ